MILKNAIVRFLVCSAFLAAAMSASAVDRSNYTIVGRHVVIKHPVTPVKPNFWYRDAKLTTIASTLSTYEFGVYFCCYNYYVTGSSNTIGVPEYWEAAPFTPSANISATEVDASVVWAEGTNEIVLGLYSDSKGLPGKALHTWHVKNIPIFASCCDLATGKSAAGIPLTKGKQYWVVVKTDSNDSDIFAGWDANTTDMRAHPLATHCIGTAQQCGANNNKWFMESSILPGYAVMGK